MNVGELPEAACSSASPLTDAIRAELPTPSAKPEENHVPATEATVHARGEGVAEGGGEEEAVGVSLAEAPAEPLGVGEAVALGGVHASRRMT
jgi:hypothetical protein